MNTEKGMMKFSFSEDDLRTAAIIVSDAMLDSLPESSNIKYVLSDEFTKKMDALCAQARHRIKVHNVLKRIAVFILAVLITLSTWFTFNANARATFLIGFVKYYENHIIYRFFNQSTIDILPTYNITWMPENFKCIADDLSIVRRVSFYENEITNDAVVFDYYLLDEGFQTHYINDFGNCEPVMVNGKSGDYYPASGDSTTNNLIWIDEESGIVFHLDSTLSKFVILHIAESVILEK